jgi:hypothetical protein
MGVNQDPAPFPCDRVSHHVFLPQELSSHLSSKVHDGNVGSRGHSLTRLPLLRPSSVVSSRELLGPLKFVGIPTKTLDWPEVKLQCHLLGVAGDNTDSDTTQGALHMNVPITFSSKQLRMQLREAL